MKNKETQTSSASSKKMRSLLSRLLVALITLSLGAILILWDAGYIEIPFLHRKDRRPPITKEETEGMPETKEEVQILTQEIQVVDWSAFAREQIEALYDFSFLENGKDLIPQGDFDLQTMSLVKTRLPQKNYTSARGYLISPEGKMYRAGDLTPIPGSEEYTITSFLDNASRPVFFHKQSNEYYILDSETLTFSPTTFDPALHPEDASVFMPYSYGAGEEGKSLTFADGLYGYKGQYLDGRRKREFTVEPQYPVAFEYAEGYAVMADSAGKVTIRNDRGEAVLTHLNLILPEKKGEEALGFHYFDHGLLRVVFATYDETGALSETREGVIDAAGNEYTFPQGYTPHSYFNGIFVLTNGESFGYYSASSAWISSPVYSYAGIFQEGLAVVKNREGKAGLIDTAGKQILPCAFDSIDPFSHGISVVTYEEGTFLLTRVTGNFMPDGMINANPPVTSLTTKITITRGPQNTFDNEESEILELPEVVTTTTKKLLPEFWE